MYFNMQLLSYSQLHDYIIYGTDVATVYNLYSCIPLQLVMNRMSLCLQYSIYNMCY